MRRSPAYYEYLASPAWGAVRARVFATRQRRCERCKIFGVKLDVHHKTYAHFGNESDDELELLCRHCHDAEHALRRPRSRMLNAIAAAQRGSWRK